MYTLSAWSRRKWEQEQRRNRDGFLCLETKPNQNKKLLIPKLNMSSKTTSSSEGQTHMIGSWTEPFSCCVRPLIEDGLCCIYIPSFFELEKAMAPHSSTPAWKIPWTEEPGGLQSMGSLRVRHDWVTSLSLFTFMHWRRKWQSTPVFLPGESQGRGSLVGYHLWGHTESDTTEVTYQQQRSLK